MTNAKETFIEREEIYQKQSYRTRCHIYSSEGIYPLRVPVLRGGSSHDHHISISKIKIDYSENWIQQHKRALIAAYMNSPYFEYYCDDLFNIIDSKEEYLFNLNSKLLTHIRELIGIDYLPISNTPIYEPPASGLGDDLSGYYIKSSYSDNPLLDLRMRIHPKFKGNSVQYCMNMEKPYFQVFSQKQGFIPNLSILDLLFNEGPNSISFLR